MPPNDTAKNGLPNREFTASMQTEMFEGLKQRTFSGKVTLAGFGHNNWTFYLYLGRIVYATGGVHPVRRFRRNLVAHLPKIPSTLGAWKADLQASKLEDFQGLWEYELLYLWVEGEKTSLENVSKMVRGILVEVMFDLAQQVDLKCTLKPEDSLAKRLVLIDSEQVIAEAKKQWQAWQTAKIADRSPDLAPVIVQAEELQKNTSEQVYKTLSQLLDGQHTFRDLSVRMKRDVLTVTRSLLPYVQSGMVKLVEIQDLPAPINVRRAASAQGASKPKKGSGKQTVIACVDDSPLICQTMEKIITAAGYEFVGVNDALRAIAILLAKKPDLIFLDLVMPNANGYEICAQLRKLSFFRNTPIIILTGNDGLIDRVRAKMVGSSDFLTKPVNSEIVLDTIRKHLKVDPAS
ncbi:MAG: response regulator [Gomphosphaeria aponina SAG 52.96 = DSM 107014]|uniref:Protein PatA n=1 Tax=Gomphosphaeria aponina SAG 52.96 = DSM 107014 TaxID=1521640 RepID=A0A941GWJ6_9CHRO|nr:response regulator [Gomphosphaeria aponina SAG 52.96 = DSM 107014]